RDRPVRDLPRRTAGHAPRHLAGSAPARVRRVRSGAGVGRGDLRGSPGSVRAHAAPRRPAVGRSRRMSLARAWAGTARLRVLARRRTPLEGDGGGRRGDAWMWSIGGARSLAPWWREGAARALRRVARRAGPPGVGPGCNVGRSERG